MAYKRGYANSENAGPAFTNALAIWVKQSPLVEKSVVLNVAPETLIKVNWIFLWHAL